MIFELHKGKVTITDGGLAIPEFHKLKELDKTKGHKRFYEAITYIHWVYDKNSKYNDVLINDRRLMVVKEQVTLVDTWEKLEKWAGVKECIDKLDKIQFTYNERLLEGARSRIEEYLELWRTTKITADNHKIVKETLEGAKELLKIKGDLEKIVFKEKSERQVGGGDSKLFEDG